MAATRPLASQPSTVVRLEGLALTAYRNLESVRLELPHAGIAIVGDNGQGKTNLLEAVYYLQLLRSFRGTRDVDVACFEADGFHIGATVAGSPRGAQAVSIGFDRVTRRKKITLDGLQPARMSDAYGAVPTVLCSPDDRDVVAAGPAARRRFLDVMLAAVSQRYLASLQQYRNALQQRNAALREIARGRGDDSLLAAWEPALVTHGAAITTARLEWVAGAAARFVELCAAIGEAGPVTLEYSTRTDSENPERSLACRLEESRAMDVRRLATHAGPHRDDLSLTIAGREMREFASAGQQRTAALALRMLEAWTMTDAFDAAPLLLLDDPFAELDRTRATRILELLRGIDPGQTFLCVPRADDIPPELSFLQRWTIAGGELRLLD